MQVLVTSDAHGRYDLLSKISEKYPNKNYHLDAGDLILTEKELEHLNPTAVKGNGDIFLDLPLRKILIIDHKRILLVHGHEQAVKYGLQQLIDLAESIGVDIVIYGHTHVQKLWEHNGITYLNPGAVSNVVPQYAIIDNGKITLNQGV